MARPIRTSETDPLWVAELPVGSQGGRMGLTLCPGRQDPQAYGGEWRRSLAADLHQIRQWNAAAVCTLVETQEMEMLGVADLGTEVHRLGMQWFHLPIVDLHAPDERFHTEWRKARPTIHSHLQAGSRVLLHCRAGLGRAGTVAALLLLEHGTDAPEAIASVRAVRPGAIESRAQMQYLSDWKEPHP